MCVSVSSNTLGGLDNSKVRTNGKQERFKDWGSSPAVGSSYPQRNTPVSGMGEESKSPSVMDEDRLIAHLLYEKYIRL